MLDRTRSSRRLIPAKGEADQILLKSFRALGALSQNGKVQNDNKNEEDFAQLRIADLDAAQVVRCVGLALQKLGRNKDQDFVDPKQESFGVELQGNVMQKHRQCTYLASKVKQLGYSRECGYNTLLYPSERSTRDLLTFLAEKLAELATDEPFAEGSRLEGSFDPMRQVRKGLSAWSRDLWSVQTSVRNVSFGFHTQPLGPPPQPHQCTNLQKSIRRGSNTIALSREEVCALIERNRLCALQKRRADEDGSALAWPLEPESKDDDLNRQSMGRQWHVPDPLEIPSERFATTTTLDKNATTSVVTPPPVPPRPQVSRQNSKSSLSVASSPTSGGDLSSFMDSTPPLNSGDDSIQSLREQLAKLEAAVEVTTAERLALQSKTELTREAMIRERALENDYREQIVMQEQILAKLPGCPDNLASLEAELHQAVQDQEDSARAWSDEQGTLLEELKNTEMTRDKRAMEASELVTTMQKLNEEIHMMEKTLQIQQDHVAALREASAKLDDTNESEQIIHRIRDVVDQVRRQSEDINRVIQDTLRLQSDINRMSQRLRRTEDMADDLVFFTSENRPDDPAGPLAYKLLHDMRVLFDELVDIVKRTGTSLNRAQEMESRAANLRSKVSNEQLDLVLSDLAAIRAENKRLEEHTGSLSR